MSAAFTEDFSKGFEAPRPRTPSLQAVPGVYGAFRFTPEVTRIQGSAQMMTEGSEVMPQEPTLAFSMPFDRCQHEEVECIPDKMILSRPLHVDLELYRGDTYVWGFSLFEDEAKTIPVDLLTLFPQFAGKTVAMIVAGQLRTAPYAKYTRPNLGYSTRATGMGYYPMQWYHTGNYSYFNSWSHRYMPKPPEGSEAWATITGVLDHSEPMHNRVILTLSRDEALKIPTDVSEGVWDLQVVQQEVEVVPAFSSAFRWDFGGEEIDQLGPEFDPRFYRAGYAGNWSTKHRQYTSRSKVRPVGEPAVRTVVAGNVTLLKDVTRVTVSH